MNTFLEVQDIFYSGTQAFRGNKDLINDIVFFLDEKYLTLSKVSVGTKEEYLALLDSLSSRKDAYDAAGGSKNHVALKLLTGEYLKMRGFHNILYEYPFCGYYPDVMTKDNFIIAECGHTDNADKMLKYFQQGNIREFIQVPYPTQDSNLIFGYIFLAGNRLKEFLNFLESERRNELRQLINGIHRNGTL